MNLAKLQGRFIEIDGPDGAGKATQIELLRQRLLAEGLDVLLLSFPRYGHPSAMDVERYLAGEFGSLDQVDPRDASRYYAEDRRAASPEIMEALASGTVVLSDRFVTANMGHQGGKFKDPQEQAEYFEWLHDLEYGEFAIPRPDLTIILWINPGISFARTHERRQGVKADLHEGSSEHISAAIRTYRSIAKTFSYPLIDCGDDSIEVVADRVWGVVVEKFGTNRSS